MNAKGDFGSGRNGPTGCTASGRGADLLEYGKHFVVLERQGQSAPARGRIAACHAGWREPVPTFM